ncbi:hypothetical protein B0H14DRAFT_3430692 [Mycena olivaceomarginata]|nr:hypothetical protein B0H14DRAFT_3430692 [Mycena olivaceomarginata]
MRFISVISVSSALLWAAYATPAVPAAPWTLRSDSHPAACFGVHCPNPFVTGAAREITASGGDNDGGEANARALDIAIPHPPCVGGRCPNPAVAEVDDIEARGSPQRGWY